MNSQVPVLIQKLLKLDGERGYLTDSDLKSRESQELQGTLLSLDLLEERTEGRRVRFYLTDREAFGVYVREMYPAMGVDPEMLAAPPVRWSNILKHRNSKRGASSHKNLPVQGRCFGAVHPELLQWGEKYGVFAVCADRLDLFSPLPEKWSLLTVENWESFYRLKFDNPATPILAIYLAGNVSKHILQALAALRPLPETAVHFGDFDAYGLLIFKRLLCFWPGMRLHIPEDIGELFRLHGRAVKGAPRINSRHPDVLRVLGLMAEYNAILEQEICPQPKLSLGSG